MKKFEVGNIYIGQDDIEIKVIKRTEKTITFKYNKSSFWEQDTDKTFRRKIQNSYTEFESINLGNHWSEPTVKAI